MSLFRVTWFLKGRPNRHRPAVELERAAIRVGTGPDDDVRLIDPFVAAQALVLQSVEPGVLRIDPQDLLAGAFVNGCPIDGETVYRPGDVLQVGQALIEFKVDGELFALDVKEDHLGHTVFESSKRKLKLEMTTWGEADWGRSRTVRAMYVAVALIGVMLLAASLVSSEPELLSRGPLSSVHKAAGVSCKSCHSAFSGQDDALCISCHEGFEGKETHPYGAQKSCASCHTEHRGNEPLSPLIEFDPHAALDGSLKPSAQCLACHTNGLPTTTAPKVRDQSIDTPFLLAFNAFSHKDHLQRRFDGKPLDCAMCHKAGATATDAADDDHEFAPITYETCLDCHATWRVRDHGRGESCNACHADSGAGTLKETTLKGGGGLYQFLPRDHDVSPASCRTCHVSGEIQRNPRFAPRAFRHDHHLAHSAQSGKVDIAKAQAQCASCHPGIAKSTTLDRLEVDVSNCAECHGKGSTPLRTEAPGFKPRRARDIVHRAHVFSDGRTPPATLEMGCLSCHTVTAGGAEPMRLREGVDNCSACHTGHDNLGHNNTCARCHKDPDAPATSHRLEPSIFSKQKRVEVVWPKTERFEHTSLGHNGVDCATCHEGLKNAAERKQIGLPKATDASCQKCHNVSRFHR